VLYADGALLCIFSTYWSIAFIVLVCARVFLLDGSLKSLANLLTPVPWVRIWETLPLLAARLPNATTDVWEGFNHFGCLADPDRTLASIAAAFGGK